MYQSQLNLTLENIYLKTYQNKSQQTSITMMDEFASIKE